MSDTLYNKSESVSALNRIDGFDPMEFARKIDKEGQETQLYLDVKYRKLWFRLVYPAGKILSRILNYTDSMALVEARIYLDKADNEEQYIANSFSQRFRSDDPQYGDKFLETAQTAAIGRALADAGFGIQFIETEENDPNQVDAGIAVPGSYDDTMNSEKSSQIPRQENQIPAGQPQTEQQNMMNTFYQQAQANGNTYGQTIPFQGQQTTVPGSPGVNGSNSTPSVSSGNNSGGMTYEEAIKVIVPGSGTYGGKTMGQVAIESPSSMEWFATQYAGNPVVSTAAKVILSAAMPMAG